MKCIISPKISDCPRRGICKLWVLSRQCRSPLYPARSSYAPSEEEDFASLDEDMSSDDQVVSSGEEDLVVHNRNEEDFVVPNRNEQDLVAPNGNQASGNSENDAIIVLGSDEESLPDPAENLDMHKIARLNRNSIVLDTRTFCPMCRSPLHVTET